MTLPELDGLDPAWSRRVGSADAEGAERTWHVLDNGPALAAKGQPVRGTVLCVHGNPTWSYLWRRVIDQAPPGWRVIAPDHLGMGFSERTESPRRLAQRIQDLDRLTATLGLEGPVVLLAHDWGGPIGLGWALRHVSDLAGVVLTNTAVHQPEGSPAPTAIRLARTPGVLDLVCRRTPTFVRATTAISRPTLPPAVRDGFAAPYSAAQRRAAVAGFVEDIPLVAAHPSMPALQGIQDGLPALADVSALLVWGPSDPVFSQLYLEDMLTRLPHADVHRYPGASHLVLEDRPEGVGMIWDWVGLHASAAGGGGDRAGTSTATGLSATTTPADPEPSMPGHATPSPTAAAPPTTSGAAAPVTSAPEPAATVPIVVDSRDPDRTAIVELSPDGGQITFGELAERVEAVARGLTWRGVSPGDRVAVLVPPGIDLTTLVYALWRLRAVVVVADAGLGLRRLGGALRGAGIDHVVAITKALALATVSGVPGTRIRFERSDVEALIASGVGVSLPEDASAPDADGAVLFTSGATGPPKGVVYSRGRLGAQVALLRNTFGFGPQHRFVAAFAPFALYGPALGMASAVPDMDVTAPHTLTAAALAHAVQRAEASVVFASPAALRNVVATAGGLSVAQRQSLGEPELVLSAGAPVPPALLRQVKELLPAAATHTPYGMTEALPVTTFDPTTLTVASDGGETTPSGADPGSAPGTAPVTPAGVCVGTPVPGVRVRINPLGLEPEALSTTAGLLGEILVHGPHTKSRYDRLWGTQRASDRPCGWHRTGDVGCFDAQGRLWVQGRLAHVLWTPDGPVAPYATEQRLEALPGVAAAALVGVGPPGTQQAVAIVVPRGRLRRSARAAPLAPAKVAVRVRQEAGVPLAAVLVRDWLPVDIRHASKVDRADLARWASRWLHGRAAARALRPRTGSAPTTRSR